MEQAPDFQGSLRADNSPQSANSEPDVNVFAENMVQQMEARHQETADSLDLANDQNLEEIHEIVQRSSTPVPTSSEQPADASLTHLETGLRVATTSLSFFQLPIRAMKPQLCPIHILKMTRSPQCASSLPYPGSSQKFDSSMT